jgi:hypothetical protein
MQKDNAGRSLQPFGQRDLVAMLGGASAAWPYVARMVAGETTAPREIGCKLTCPA